MQLVETPVLTNEPPKPKTTICPIKPPAQYDPNTGATIYFKCEREECEWWDSAHTCCCVFSISGELGQIASLLKG
jgi:predicted component of type VI protein secretion system